MSDEIVINACESDEIVIYDEDGNEELLLSAEGVVIVVNSITLPIAQTDVSGLSAELAALSATDAAQAAAIGNKADAVHGHVASDVAGLVVALAQVEANRLAILSKADQTALSALALLVDTKADQSAVAQQIAELVGTDAQVLAAITALGEALADDQDLLDALEYTVANRVRFDVNNQALTSLQKANARTNIGAEEIGVAALLITQITAASLGAATAAQGAKADAALAATDAPAAVRDTTLTGLSTATATPITAADSVLSAAGKLQAQITAQAPRNKVPAITGRYYTNCNLGATFSSSSVAAGQLRTAFFEPLADMTIDQIGVFLTVAPTAGSRIKIAIYEFDATNPSQLNLVHSVAEIIADATIGAKLVSTSFSFKLGRVYVITHLSDQSLAMRNFSASAGLAAGLATVDATAPITLWVATGVAYSATAPATLNLATLGTLTSNTSLILMRAV